MDDATTELSLITIDQTPVISVDFDAARQQLTADLERYDVVVTADTVGAAKKLATDLNKRAGEIDRIRKDRIAEVSAPIKAADDQMKELVRLCKDGRQKLLDQIQRFEDETRASCRQLLETELAARQTEYGVDGEFRRSTIDDLVMISHVTGGGKLTAKALAAVRERAMADKAAQDRIRTRLLELANRCYEAGLSTPLTRQHVTAFLESDDETYQAQLQRLLDTEIERQHQAEQRLRERIERDRLQQEAPDRAEAERIERHRVREAETQSGDDRAPAPDPVAAGKTAWIVTARVKVQAPAGIDAGRIETRMREVLTKAGITNLDSVEARRV